MSVNDNAPRCHLTSPPHQAPSATEPGSSALQAELHLWPWGLGRQTYQPANEPLSSDSPPLRAADQTQGRLVLVGSDGNYSVERQDKVLSPNPRFQRPEIPDGPHCPTMSRRTMKSSLSSKRTLTPIVEEIEIVSRQPLAHRCLGDRSETDPHLRQKPDRPDSSELHVEWL